MIFLSSFRSKTTLPSTGIAWALISPPPRSCSTHVLLPEFTLITATQGLLSRCERSSAGISAVTGRNAGDTTTDCPSEDQLAVDVYQDQYPRLIPSGALIRGFAVPSVRLTSTYWWGIMSAKSTFKFCGPALIRAIDLYAA